MDLVQDGSSMEETEKRMNSPLRTEVNISGKRKILIVHNYYQIPGGEDTVVAGEKKLLEEHGHRVILYTRNNLDIQKMNRFRKCMLPLISLYNPGTAREIRKMIREQGVEIVHVHNTLHLISPAVYYAARRCDVPVFQTVHNFRLLCPGAAFFRDGRICEDCVRKGLGCAVRHGCYRGSRAQTLVCVLGMKLHRALGIYGKIRYICLTEFNREKLLQLKQIPPENVFVKPNFVDVVPEDGGRSGFLYAGRLEEWKGLRTLMEAWRLMGENAPVLTVCGSGPLEGWCKKVIRELGLHIELRGFVENGEVRQLMSRSRALILPTLLYEGFPMSIAEAFAAGTPVICSDVGNAGSLVEEGVTGWKFEPGNAADLVRAIGRWTDLSDRVRKVYESRYTAESNYRQLMEIYGRGRE